MKKTTVVNRAHHLPTPDDVYIGRPGFWGNPFRIGADGTREEVIAKHLQLLRDRMTHQPQLLTPLIGKTLVCWCKPLPCHGDNYILLLKEQGKIP